MRSRTHVHSSSSSRASHARTRPSLPAALSAGIAIAVAGMLAIVASAPSAQAIGTNVGLGTATSYSVLGGQSVTNTGSSVLSDDVGVSPGTDISGFPPGITLGTTHQTDAHAAQAQLDLATAYDAAASQATDGSISGDLGGLTLLAGVYTAASSIALTGTLTLNAQGDPDAVFLFQVGSDLTTASGSTVAMINGGQSCNVYWQIGRSATLGSNTTFVGTIMALTSVSLNTGSTVDGRALARNGSVTLDGNTFTRGACTTAAATSTSSAPASSSPSASSSQSASASSSSSESASGSASGSASPSSSAPTSGAATTSASATSTSATRVTTAVNGSEELTNTSAGSNPLPLLAAGGVLVAVGLAVVAAGTARARARNTQ